MTSGTSKCGNTECEWSQPWLTPKAITNAGNDFVLYAPAVIQRIFPVVGGRLVRTAIVYPFCNAIDMMPVSGRFSIRKKE
jgi:hypothetical protein